MEISCIPEKGRKEGTYIIFTCVLFQVYHSNYTMYRCWRGQSSYFRAFFVAFLEQYASAS